jgi:DNA-binding HxlR family transcriptional regulator
VTPSSKFEKIGQAAELLLKAKFGDIVEEANFSFLSCEKVNAWIKLTQLATDTTSEIESYLQSLLNESGVQFISYQWVGENNTLPTPINILIALKRLQPLNIEGLIEHFITDYRAIDAKWLNRQLDKMLKKQLIIRDRVTENYALTGTGLGLIPSVRSKYSSDVARALELGKRKW